MATPYTPFKDQYRTYAIGDPVLVFLHDHHGEMTEGRVVHIFPHHCGLLYVVEIDTFIEPIYEVRSGHLLGMRPAKGSMEYDSWASSLTGDTRDEGVKNG